jgi:hypothetical protein
MATTAIDPRMTHSPAISLSSGRVDGHGHDELRAGRRGDRLDRAARAELLLLLGVGLGGQAGPVAGRHPAHVSHRLRDDLDVLFIGRQHEQAVARLAGFLDHIDQPERGQGGRPGRFAVGRLGQQIELALHGRRVGPGCAYYRLGERVAVVRGRVQGQRHDRADQHQCGEGQQHDQDAPGHAEPPEPPDAPGSASRKPWP